MDLLKVLFVGDIVGKTGRKVLKEILPEIKKNFYVSFVIANVENAAHGNGLTEKIYNEIVNAGVNCLTSGNHIWDKKEILKWIDTKNNLLRPLNYPPNAPGKGYAVFNIYGIDLTVINLMGRVFMQPIDCPFRKLEEIIQKIKKPIIVDFHAEATSEKIAFGYFADGKVTAVIGTHTHVQTSDNEILPKGTGYITDIGMTGSFDSVIGGEREPIIKRFLSGIPYKFEPAKQGEGLDGCIIEIEKNNFLCKNIIRMKIRKINGEFILKMEDAFGNYNMLKLKKFGGGKNENYKI